MRALVVNEMPTQLHRPAQINIEPLRLDNLPAIDLPKQGLDYKRAAIVSWRWDVVDGSSRNLRAALCVAQKWGYEYLLFDKVSVDQQSPQEFLVEQIAGLADLFLSMPVICAYDIPDMHYERWLPTFRRPWIFYECKTMSMSWKPKLYAGHVKTQGLQAFPSYLRAFPNMNFAPSLLYLLQGDFDVGNYSDLKYMVPKHTRHLDAASRRLSRQDFIMLVLLVCMQNAKEGRVREDSGDLRNDLIQLSQLKLDRFSWHLNRQEQRLDIMFNVEDEYIFYDLRFDGEPVAEYCFKFYVDRAQLETRNLHLFQVRENAIDFIAVALGIDEAPRSVSVNPKNVKRYRGDSSIYLIDLTRDGWPCIDA